MKAKMLVGIAALLVGVGVSAQQTSRVGKMSVSEFNQINMKGNQAVKAIKPTSGTLSDIDRQLLMQVAAGGQRQLAMSRAVLNKATNPQVRLLASSEVEEQTGIANKLQEIARAKGITIDQNMMQEGMLPGMGTDGMQNRGNTGMGTDTGAMRNNSGMNNSGMGRDTGTMRNNSGMNNSGMGRDTGTMRNNSGMNSSGMGRDTSSMRSDSGMNSSSMGRDTGTMRNNSGMNNNSMSNSGMGRDTGTMRNNSGMGTDTGSMRNNSGMNNGGMGMQNPAAMLERMSSAEVDMYYVEESGVKGHELLEETMTRVNSTAKDPALKKLAAATLPVIRTHLKVSRDLKTTLDSGTGNNGNSNTNSNTNNNK